MSAERRPARAARLRKILVLAVCAAVTGLLAALPARAAGVVIQRDAASDVVVHPQEINDVLDNPGMGWVFIDNAIPGHNDEGRTGAYPNFTNVAVLSDWAELEPQPGVYNWTMVDNAINYWAGQGKHIEFRISTDPMVITGYNYSRGAPDWLYQPPYSVGSQIRCDDATLTPPTCKYPNGTQDITYTVPDYENPTYMTRLHSFLQALGARYDGNPNIETVDLRGYGEWGEWHSGHDFTSYAARESTLQQIIHEWSIAFPDKVLLLSDSYEYRGGANGMQPAVSDPTSYAQYQAWSGFDYALNSTPNVSFRRDGVAGALHEYDSDGLQDAFRSARDLPIALEFYDGYPIPAGFPYTVQTRLDEAFEYHPNYLTVMGWDGDTGARQFYDDEPAAIQEANLMLGYRFVLTQASYPSVVAPGGTLELRQDWVNRAVGRAWKKYPLTVYLTDSAGNTVWSGTDSSFDQRGFVRGSTYPVSSKFTIPSSLAPGSYQLRIAMVDSSGNPAIQLAIAGKDSQGRYPLGPITVGSGTPSPGTEDFEGGSFTNSSYTAGYGGTYGTITSDPSKVVDGSYSAYGSAPTSTDWYEFLYSDTAKLSLQPLTTYTVTFKYRALSSPGAGGYDYVLARTGAGGVSNDVGFTTFDDPPDGTVRTKSVTFTTNNFGDYYLIWGLHDGGALSVDDITVTLDEWETFEGGTFAASAYTGGSGGVNGVVTSDPAKVVDGQYSAYGTAPTSTDWYEFLYSDPGKLPLRPLTSYTATFRYRVLGSPGAGGYGYFLARTASGGNTHDVGVTELTDPADGTVRTKTVTFTTDDFGDYYLDWGLHNGGALSIDDITVVDNADLADSLAGQWEFDEGNGSTTTSADGTITATLQPGATWTNAGRRAYGVALDGNTGYVAIPNTTTLQGVQAGDYTLAISFNAASLPSGSGSANNADYGLLMKPGWNLGLYYDNTGHFHMVHLLSDGTSADAMSLSTYAPGTWHSVVGVVSKVNGTVDLYVDDTWQATARFTPGTSARDYGSAGWNIGIGLPGGSSYRWAANGTVDDARIWNRALSDTDVMNLNKGY